MTLPHLDSNDLTKLRSVVKESVTTMEEIQALREGMNETIKGVAEELNISPKLLKKAVTFKFKNNLPEAKEEMDETEQLVELVNNPNIKSA